MLVHFLLFIVYYVLRPMWRGLVSCCAWALAWFRSSAGTANQIASLVYRVPELERALLLARQDAARHAQRVSELEGEVKANEIAMETLVRTHEMTNALLKESVALSTYRAMRRSRIVAEE